MGRIYVDTGGNANNSGSRDTNAALYAITVHSSYAGGATIPIVETHDLSVLNLSGDTQDSVNFTDATNVNQDIFWISAVDNVASPKTITVTVAPTGLTAGTSTGNIGGRILLAGLTGEESVLRAGDEVIINNSPAASALLMLTMRTSGSFTGGFVKVRGATGVRPVLNVTSTPSIIDCNAQDMIWLENLEFDQDGASGNAINNMGGGSVVLNCKIVDAGGDGIDINEDGIRIIGCEITGCGGDGIDSATFTFIQIIGCYIHTNTGNGWNAGATVTRSLVLDTVFKSNSGSGINLTGAPAAVNSCLVVYGCTFYGNLTHGLTATDADHAMVLMNNIFLDNGDTGTEYNLNWPASFQLCNYGNFNIFNQGGGLGGTNLNNYTVQSNDLTTAPDINTTTFLPSSTSPAKAAGFPGTIPFTGATLTGYKDIGAMQRQEPAGGSGSAIIIKRSKPMKLRQSTAVTVPFGPFVSTAGATVTSLIIQKADVRIKKNGGDATAASADQGALDAGAPHDEKGVYDGSLNTTDTNTLGRMNIIIEEAGAVVWEGEFEVVPAQVWDSFYSTDLLQVDVREFVGVTAISGAIPAVAAGANGGLPTADANNSVKPRAIRESTAQAGAAGSITLDAAASATDNLYRGELIWITGGTGAGQVRVCSGYTGASKVATVDENWITNPDNTSTFAVLPFRGASLTSALKVAGVVLTDTVTTYTGNTPQTGDSYALAAGANGFAAIKTDTGNLVTRITSTLFSGITQLSHWLGAIAGKQAANATAQTEIRASGAGSGTYDPTTDSNEAIRDNMGTAQTGDSFARLGAPAGASVSADVAAVKTDTGNLVTRITSTLFSGITQLSHWLGALAGKQAANATAQTEIRATGAGAGTFDPTSDSLEAIRDAAAVPGDIADAVWDEATTGHTTAGTTGERLTRIPNAAAGGNGGLPTVNASNYIAGMQGTINTLDALDTAQDAQHATTQGLLPTSLSSGRLRVDVEAINASTAAAVRQALAAGTIIPGTVDHTGAAATTTIFEADDITEATADHYNGRVIIFTSGAMLGQATSISDYALNAGRGRFTVPALTEAPPDNTTFIII